MIDEKALSRWLATLSSPHTRDAYGRDVRAFAAWMAANDLSAPTATVAHVSAFRKVCLDAGDSASTVNRRLAAIASFFRHLGSATAGNPAWRAARSETDDRSRTEPLDAATAERVWRAAVKLGPRAATIVGLLMLDGLKTNEVLGLDVADVEPRRGAMSALVPRRTGMVRVRLDARTAGVVRAALAGRVDGPLLLGENPTRGTARLTRFGADYLIKRTGRAAAVSAPLTANILRSTYINRALAGGASMEEVREVVGHSSARTTRRYLPL
jgi:site-specific recombinase XerD